MTGLNQLRLLVKICWKQQKLRMHQPEVSVIAVDAAFAQDQRLLAPSEGLDCDRPLFESHVRSVRKGHCETSLQGGLKFRNSDNYI